jgi:valyl-tRNA synthetase
MALNAASRNVTDATTQDMPGCDNAGRGVGNNVKSDKEFEKERKKAEKNAKFQAKKVHRL